MGIACERTASVAICDHSVAIASGSGSGSGLESAPPEEQYFRKEKAGGSSPPVGSKFNKTISLHLLDDFLSQKCGMEMLFRTGLCIPNLVWQGHSEWHQIRRSVGETVVAAISRSAVAPSWRT